MPHAQPEDENRWVRSILLLPGVYLSLFVAGSVLFMACGGGQSGSNAADDSTNVAQEEPVESVGIFQGAPVRKSPDADGTWLTSLNVGETFEFLRQTKVDTVRGKPREYSKVRLRGGDEGWVRSDMIVANAGPAAILQKTALHERPTAMASTDEYFWPMDIVAVLDTQETWIRVRGIRRGENWWDTGWVQPKALTRNETDVVVAGLWKKARGEEDSTKRRQKIEEIVSNPSFDQSVFVDSLKARLDTSDANGGDVGP